MQPAFSQPVSGDVSAAGSAKGRRTLLKSKRTWYRHLECADDDEQVDIRFAYLSEGFCSRIRGVGTPGGNDQSPSSVRRPKEVSTGDGARPLQSQRIAPQVICFI